MVTKYKFMKKETKQLDKKVEKLEEKLQAMTERWKRSAADYANLEKQIDKEKKAMVGFSTAVIIKRLLPVLDSLKEAVKSAQDTGFGLILKQFGDILKEEGVVEIKAAGEEFDPQKHEAVEVIYGGEDGKVVEILRGGYKIRGKVIRPAQVRVVKKEPQKDSERVESELVLK